MSEGGDKENPTDDEEEEETTEEEEEEAAAAGSEAKSPEEEEDTEEEEDEKKSIGKASTVRTEGGTDGGIEGGDTAKSSATGTERSGTGSAVPSGSIATATSSDARSSRLTSISNAMPSVNFGFSLSKWVEIFKNFPPPRDEDLPRSVICGLSEGATTKSKDKEQKPPPKPTAGGQPVAEAEIMEPDFTEDESELSLTGEGSDGPRTPDYEDGDRSLTNIQQTKDKGKTAGGKQTAGGEKGSQTESTDDEEDTKKLSSDESIFLSL